MSVKVLIMGLPGSGKTTLAKELSKKLRAVHFNADEVRKKINNRLGFSENDRLEQAKRMGYLCDIVNRAGVNAVADFICPTSKARKNFGKCYTIFMNTIKEGRFEDTNKMFVKPRKPDLIIKNFSEVNVKKIVRGIKKWIRKNQQR